MKNVLAQIFCGSLFFIFHFSFFTSISAQDTIASITRWVATVDEYAQQIVLSWTPSADPQAMGYHICTGNPCLDYDTVFGQQSNRYVCIDHNALERHTYRIHVFDSAYNVSALTPTFGNIVLTAVVPPCSTEVTASWTPYDGMPGGVASYKLWGKFEPLESGYSVLYSTDTAGPLTFQFEIPEGVSRVVLKLQALGYADSVTGTTLVSQSNVVSVERLTIDSAAFFYVSSATYDSTNTSIQLFFVTDTSFVTDHYTLWRSIDGSPWSQIATLPLPLSSFVDYDVNPFDSLFCYRLSVTDACDMNEKYSTSCCVVVPDPQPPAVAIPNIIVVSNPDNSTFLPRLRGLKGDLFELYLYNRQGILVFSTHNPTEGWTPDTSTPQGVYTYAIRCRYNNNIVKTYIGTVLVIK